MTTNPTCPKCGGKLQPVLASITPSVLNVEQLGAINAGDWYCKTCKGDRAKYTHYRYYWNSEIGYEESSEVARDIQWKAASKAIGDWYEKYGGWVRCGHSYHCDSLNMMMKAMSVGSMKELKGALGRYGIEATP